MIIVVLLLLKNERVMGMIKLNLDMPKSRLDCPFMEEDPDDNTLWCYFEPQVGQQCIGLFKGECPIIKDDSE